MIEILNRYTRAVLYASETADSIASAVAEALKSRANLTDADLYRANLTGANLIRANLTDADLIRANLTDANLTGANLIRANLTDANLTGADLYGADLYGANLEKFRCVIPGSRHVITATDKRVSIGCHTYTIGHWLEHFRAIGRAEKYTDEQIEEYGENLNRIEAMMKLWAAKEGA